MSIGIFYGSDNGTTTDVCERLAEKLGDAELVDVSSAESSMFESYEKVILASSTWGDGDLQNDWEEFSEKVKGYDFGGKTVALLSLGDADSYGSTFCDALYHLNNVAQGANIVGQVSADEYEFESSKSVSDGKFLGLPIDEVNEDDKTNDRLDAWVKILKENGF